MGHADGARERAPTRRTATRGLLHLRPQVSGRLTVVLRALLAVSIASLGAIALVPAAADAAFPGANGLIVFVGSGLKSGHSCSASEEDLEDQLLAVPIGGTNPFQLTCTAGRDMHPFVSPDGTRVVFSNAKEGGASQLFMLALPSTPPPMSWHQSFAKPSPVSDAPQASDDYPS
jgi:hypothetical protein